MRVLGVDPGLTRCGVGVVDGAPGRRLALVHVEVLRTPADADIGARLAALADGLDEAMDQFAPDVVAVERVFSQQNVRTVMGTAQVSGVALVLAARRGLPVALHTPSEVKAAVTGNGRADKAQVGAMVARLLALPAAPAPADAADALALAICHAVARTGPRPPGPRRDGTGPMISFVRGTVAAVGPEQVVVDVGGLGLALQCTPGTISGLRVGDRAQVPACLVVREDSLTLFGFADDDERAVFEAVQTVSGIGPRLAQSILAVLSPDDLRRAVAADDLAVAHPGPGHRPQGGGPAGAGAQGQARPARRGGRRCPVCRPRTGRAAGAARCPRRWSASAGRRGRPRSRSTPSPQTSRPAPARARGPGARGDGPAHEGRASRPGRRRRPAEGRPARPGPFMSTCRRPADRGRPRRRRARARWSRPPPSRTTARSRVPCGRAPWPSSWGRGGSRTSWVWSWRPAADGRPRPTTCCCPGPPGSARPRWR